LSISNVNAMYWYDSWVKLQYGGVPSQEFKMGAKTEGLKGVAPNAKGSAIFMIF